MFDSPLRYYITFCYRMKNHRSDKVASNVEHGIKRNYIEFDSEIALLEEQGLLNRLREMPKGLRINVLIM